MAGVGAIERNTATMIIAIAEFTTGDVSVRVGNPRRNIKQIFLSIIQLFAGNCDCTDMGLFVNYSLYYDIE